MSILAQKNPIIGVIFHSQTANFQVEQAAEVIKIVIDELHLRAQIMIDGLPFLPPEPVIPGTTVLEKRIVIDITQES